MASPEELTPLLPETLPDDFSEWDGEASPTPSSNNAGEWEAWEAAHSFGEAPKLHGQSVDRGPTPGPLADKPSTFSTSPSASAVIKQQKHFVEWDGESSPTPKPVNLSEWEAWEAAHSFGKNPKPRGQSTERETFLSPVDGASRSSGPASSAAVLVRQPEVKNEPVSKSLSRPSHKPEASHSTNGVSLAPGWPTSATVIAMQSSAEAAETLIQPDDRALFNLLSPEKVGASAERKTAKKKWLIVAPVGAGLILLLLMIPLFHHGSKAVAKESAQPIPAATETQLETQSQNPPLNATATTDKPPASTANQPASGSQPANAGAGVNSPSAPTKTQAKMMDEQLTAPTRIPQSSEQQTAENAPPPVSLDAAGADGLGGGMGASVLNGHAQATVKVAPSKPIVVSSGVAEGMLILKAPPTYPAIAKAARVSGTVELHATISKTGAIKDLNVVSGPAMLQQAAVDAVRRWRYKPYMLSNEPVEVETTIKLVFTLGA